MERNASMNNKTVLITGATQNTGLAIARRFAAEGWNVLITSRKHASAEAAAQALMAEYPQVTAAGYEMELISVESIRRIFQAVAARFGRLDAFVANAAHLAIDMSIFNTTPDMFGEVVDTNLRGNFFCFQEAAKLMKEGGALLVISSVHADQSIYGRILYSASKAALNAMVRCLAIELGHLKIRANALVAGAIWSTRWLLQTPEETATRRAQYPAGRESSPEDIANAAYFLCSDQSLTVTGTEMTVDSGISICLLPYQNQNKGNFS